MKRLIILVSAVLCTAFVNAQGKFGLMGGINASTSSQSDVDWRVGGFVGGLYDFPLSENFLIQPRLLFQYQENQRTVKNTLLNPAKTIGDEFNSQWSVELPVLASFRFELSDNSSLRLNVGPYIQYAAFGKSRNVIYGNSAAGVPETPVSMTDLSSWHLDFGDKITYGGQAGFQWDYKKAFVTLDLKHSFHRNQLNMDGFETTLQLGIGYKF